MTKSEQLASWMMVASFAVACGNAPSSSLLLPGAGGASSGASDVDAGTPVTDGTSAGSGSAGGGNNGGSNGGSSGATGATSDAGASAADAASPGAPSIAGAGLPCGVAAMLAAKCVGCHSNPPTGGSLSALVTIGDLLATSKEDPTKNEAQLSLARMQSTSSPMPPASVGNPATATEIQAFQQWVQGNYQGSCGDAGAATAPSVFDGAPAFVSSTASSTHNAGKNCMGGCHDHGFTFAGTLTDGNGNAVAGAEVRLVDANGQAITVHSGPTGNFHSSTPFTAPAHVGARDATHVVNMVTPLQSTNGGCNGCHATGGTTAPIHLP